jgi:16S rRNA C967 or C1407 C5-methylase (RsmB/RsmF family)
MVINQGLSEPRLERIESCLSTPAALGLRVTLSRKLSLPDVTKKLHGLSVFAVPTLGPRSLLVMPSNSAVSSSRNTEPCMTAPIVLLGRACAEAVMAGAKAYAPGVCATSIGSIAPGTQVRVYADVSDRVKRGARVDDASMGDNAAFLGMGTTKMHRVSMFQKDAKGVAVELSDEEGLDFADHLLRLSGHLDLQAIPAQAAAQSLCNDLRPDSRVLDMCASPGGKSAYIADVLSLMGGSGQVYACDRNEGKVRRIKTLAQRTGLSHVLIPTLVNATTCVSSGRWKEGRFDAVLLDPPCSALGLRPRLSHTDMTEAKARSLSEYQRAMIKQAVLALKLGGSLVYSTCTITPLENEMTTRYILDTYPSLQLVDCGINASLGGMGALIADDGLSNEQASMVRRFDPGEEFGEHRVNGEMATHMGFYIAKFVKS